jgi:hypothetical protein
MWRSAEATMWWMQGEYDSVTKAWSGWVPIASRSHVGALGHEAAHRVAVGRDLGVGRLL